MNHIKIILIRYNGIYYKWWIRIVLPARPQDIDELVWKRNKWGLFCLWISKILLGHPASSCFRLMISLVLQQIKTIHLNANCHKHSNNSNLYHNTRYSVKSHEYIGPYFIKWLLWKKKKFTDNSALTLSKPRYLSHYMNFHSSLILMQLNRRFLK